ncbi:MAG: three-Cys-motif partner protein TcmP, partial [Bacillota bacterium]
MRREQSAVKANIVVKYFGAWAKIIIGQARARRETNCRIAYVDLFAGPGQYRDGTFSTPLRILKTATADADMKQVLITHFNDVDPEHVRALSEAITNLPDVESMIHRPIVHNDEVGEAIASMFGSMRLVPTLLFADPCGYRGLSLHLIGSVLKDWGCDCIFFFNYNRINMGIDNPTVKERMDELFGPGRAEALRPVLRPMTPGQRESAIIAELEESLGQHGGRFVLPFPFKSAKRNRTSHYLVFVSKSQTAYQIMKDVMAGESTAFEQGVPVLGFNPADKMYSQKLFDVSHPLDDLVDMLLDEFRGRVLTVKEIFLQHNVGKRYVVSNYKEALRQLEKEGRITAIRPLLKGRKG